MAQTLFGRDIAFTVRTFRFTGGYQTGDQDQTISCELHLEPAADVAATQPDDCSCYTEDECANAANQVSTNYRYNPSYDAVLVIGQSAGRLQYRRAGIVTLDGQWKTI